MSGLERILVKRNKWARYSLIGMSLLGCETRKMEQTDVNYDGQKIEVQQLPDCPIGQQKYYEDADGDGYGVNAEWWICEELPGYVTNNLDCDDNMKEMYPGGTEVCDGLDNNCDGKVDENIVKDCSTVCGKGIQVCQNGAWNECSVGTFCPSGKSTCKEIISCEKKCESKSGIDDCINTGDTITGKNAVALNNCTTQYNCKELYSSCIKTNCITEYTTCFEGNVTCYEVLKCAYAYVTAQQKEIEKLEEMCIPELSECIKIKGDDFYSCLNDYKYLKCEQKAKLLKEEKEKEKDIPGDFFGICITQADKQTILKLYNMFTCIYNTCGPMPTPNCIYDNIYNPKSFSCTLSTGILTSGALDKCE